MAVAAACYRLSREWPREELYGLTSQVRRSAVSIPATLAEGFGRGTRKGYLQFVFVAQGSLKETETHLLPAEQVGVA
jgi:four helix bundle protein